MSGKSPRRSTSAKKKASKSRKGSASSKAGATPKRTQPETFRARALMASLTVKDLQASVAWYRDMVGFIVAREMEFEGKVRAVRMKAGTVEVLLNQDDGAKGLDRPKGEGFSLYFTTAQSVDDVADRIKRLGGTLLMEPTEMFGSRVFRVKDPDGFTLAISSERSA